MVPAKRESAFVNDVVMELLHCERGLAQWHIQQQNVAAVEKTLCCCVSNLIRFTIHEVQIPCWLDWSTQPAAMF